MKNILRTTKRLFIRPLTEGDFWAWKEANDSSAKSLNPWDTGRAPESEISRSKFRKILLRERRLRIEDRHYSFGLFEKSSSKLVGKVSVMDVVRGVAHSAYLGYWIHNRHWRKGFGKEAVKALIDISFRELKLHRVEAGIEPSNRRSILLARSLGLRKEGLKKRMVFLRNHWVDLVMYSATCEEFGVSWNGRAPSSNG